MSPGRVWAQGCARLALSFPQHGEHSANGERQIEWGFHAFLPDDKPRFSRADPRSGWRAQFRRWCLVSGRDIQGVLRFSFLNSFLIKPETRYFAMYTWARFRP